MSKKFSKGPLLLNQTSSKLPPLRVIKDNSTQTDVSYKSGKTNIIYLLIGYVCIVFSIIYFSLCYLAIFSTRVQSLVVYSHLDTGPKMNLLDIHAMGLPEGKNIIVKTDDGLLLRGWHIMRPGAAVLYSNTLDSKDRDIFFDKSLAFADRLIVYFHGNSATRGQAFRVDTIKKIAAYLDADVITFDYRGFADSEGSPSENGTLLDSKAIVKYIESIVLQYRQNASGYLAKDNIRNVAEKDKLSRNDDMTNSSQSTITFSSKTEPRHPTPTYAQPKLFFYGHSLGSAIATASALQLNQQRIGAISGLILDSPFTDMPSAARAHPMTAAFRVFPMIIDAM